ncbi:MAG: DUF4177 domain-containing protein [Chloroflexi bacterium]|nr:DUF4177 domain-containing protein [Chloroflexota bacterium]
MSETLRWEYKAASVGSFWSEPSEAAIEETLNQLGMEGWEVVSVVAPHGTNRLRVIAKRPLTAETRRLRTWPDSGS